MGINANEDSNRSQVKDYQESWDYQGEIYQELFNKYTRQHQTIIIETLTGKIYLIKENEKYKVVIQVKIKGKRNKFYFSGEEKIHQEIRRNNETIYFMINEENNFELNEVVLKRYNDGIAALNGKRIYIIKEGIKSGPFNLDLHLSNNKKHTNTPNYEIFNTKNLEASKMINQNNPEDILMNSLCGMKNLINTCYINSSFQILLHIPQFIEIIRRNYEFEIGVIKEINDIFKLILKQYKEFRPIIDPGYFVKFFKSNHQAFNNYSQMDSEMFLEELIWDINIELGNMGEKRTKSLFNNNTKNEKINNFLNYIEESENETHFEINDLFYVYFIHEKRCEKCKYLTYYFDESPGLKLNFDHTKYQSKIDLYSLIMENFKYPIKMKSRILCRNCNQCFKVIETTRIAKLPKILILSLQKVNKENTQKIPWLVNFKNRVGIREITDIDLIQNESGLYEIFAINNHLGNTPKSGHYYSEIYLEKLKNWYSFNDEYVDKDLDWFQPKLCNYILFFKQINQ